MALATIQQIRDGQGSRLDSLSDTQIQLHLDDAAILIVALGYQSIALFCFTTKI